MDKLKQSRQGMDVLSNDGPSADDLEPFEFKCMTQKSKYSHLEPVENELEIPVPVNKTALDAVTPVNLKDLSSENLGFYKNLVNNLFSELDKKTQRENKLLKYHNESQDSHTVLERRIKHLQDTSIIETKAIKEKHAEVLKKAFSEVRKMREDRKALVANFREKHNKIVAKIRLDSEAELKASIEDRTKESIAKLEKIQSELRGKNDEVDKSRISCNQLNTKISASQKENESLKKSLAEFKNKNSRQEIKLVKLSNSVTETNNQVKEYKIKMNELELTYNSRQSKTTKMKSIILGQEEKITLGNVSLERLKISNNSQQIKIDKLNAEKADELFKQITLKNSIDEAENTRRDLSQELNFQRVKYLDIEGRFTDASRELQEVKESIQQEKSAFDNERQQLKDEVCELQKRKSVGQNELHRMNIEKDKLNQSFEQLQKSHMAIKRSFEDEIVQSELKEIDYNEIINDEAKKSIYLEEHYANMIALITAEQAQNINELYKISFSNNIAEKLSLQPSRVGNVSNNRVEIQDLSVGVRSAAAKEKLKVPSLLDQVKLSGARERLKLEQKLAPGKVAIHSSSLRKEGPLTDYISKTKCLEAMVRGLLSGDSASKQKSNVLQQQMESLEKINDEVKDELGSLELEKVALQSELNVQAKEFEKLRSENKIVAADNTDLYKDNETQRKVIAIEIARAADLQASLLLLEHVDRDRMGYKLDLEEKKEQLKALNKQITQLQAALTSEKAESLKGGQFIQTIGTENDKLIKKIAEDTVTIDKLTTEIDGHLKQGIDMEVEAHRASMIQRNYDAKLRTLGDRETQVQKYSKSVDAEKTALRKHIVILIQELKTSQCFSPLKDYANIIEEEISILDIKLARVPLNGSGRSEMEEVHERLIRQKNKIIKTIDEGGLTFDKKIDALIRLARGTSLVPIPPPPPSLSLEVDG